MKVIISIIVLVLLFSCFAAIFAPSNSGGILGFVEDLIADDPIDKAPYDVSRTYVFYEVISKTDKVSSTTVPPSLAAGTKTKFLYTMPSDGEGYIIYGTDTTTKTVFPSYDSSYGVYEYVWPETGAGSSIFTINGLNSCYVFAEPWPDNPNENKIYNYSNFDKVSGNNPYRSKIKVEGGEFYLLTVKSNDGNRCKVSLKEGSICEFYQGTQLVDDKTCAYTQYIVSSPKGSNILQVMLSSKDCTLQIQKIAVYPMDEYFYDPEMPEGPGAE